jgi:hypothetical protein
VTKSPTDHAFAAVAEALSKEHDAPAGSVSFSEVFNAVTEPDDIETLLTVRGSRYGKFKDTAQVAQELKRVLTRHAHAIEASFSDSQWEALEMICHKIARIVNGDPNYIDSWRDIAGYAQLVSDELQGIDR